jgi:hypothetical protein
LELKNITSQKSLLEDINKITPESYRKLFPDFDDCQYLDVKKYLNNPDRICCIMDLDPGTKKTIIQRLKGDYNGCKYALSFMMTIRCQFCSGEISDEKEIDKKWKEHHNSSYDFWLSLDDLQQQKIIDWYNEKDSDCVMYHPYLEYQWC